MTQLLPLDRAGSERADVDYPTLARRRLLGSAGPRVFPVAIGGNAFGWTAAEDAAEAVLDEYRSLGGNLIDTADSYAAGRSESMIGNWMHSRRNRDELIVATKIGKSAESPGLGTGAVTAAIDASLRRLRTDRIDVLFLHVDDRKVPFEETLVAVDENVRKGKVRFVGASDHSGNRFIEARVIAAQLGLTPFIALQCRYSLTHRTEFEGALATVAEQQRLGVMPRFALDGGFLAGNYRSRSELDLNSTGNVVLGGDAESHLNRRGQRILATLDRIAAEHESVPASIAIAWLLSKPTVTAPVVGVSNAGQVADLVGAIDIRLTRQQVAALDEVSA
ncbi:MAG TPA: aldo/keto reductase [Terrimesophilobacter sp.]|nr:aldo/keto reductase [Terrimesophilobacter sp.]